MRHLALLGLRRWDGILNLPPEAGAHSTSNTKRRTSETGLERCIFGVLVKFRKAKFLAMTDLIANVVLITHSHSLGIDWDHGAHFLISDEMMKFGHVGDMMKRQRKTKRTSD